MAKSTEVANPEDYTDETLRNIASFDDAIALLESQGIKPVDAAKVIGTGFAVTDDKVKDQLVGEPFLVLTWSFHPGDYFDRDGKRTDFVSAHVVTKGGRKLILNDGGTGIARQLREVTDTLGITGALVVNGGLRKSTFYIHAETKMVVPKSYDGPKSEAHTYYLDVAGEA